eukprot:jgi/Chlat1/5932/Chrsp4S09096
MLHEVKQQQTCLAHQSAPTLKEHIGQEVERLSGELLQLLASQSDVKKELEELSACNQAKQQALEARRRQLLEEQEKLEKDYAEQNLQLEQRRRPCRDADTKLLRRSASMSMIRWKHNRSRCAAQTPQTANKRVDIVNSDDDVEQSPAGNQRASPATCSATASQGDNTPSAELHSPLPRKPRVTASKKGEIYAAKRFAACVPDNRYSSEFFRKFGLDKFTLLSRREECVQTLA